MMVESMNELRADLNAAQQRAEQAERERDEARAVIDRAIEILGLPVPDGAVTKDQMANEHLNVNALLTTFRKSYYAAPQAQPAWTPLTGAEIAASLYERALLDLQAPIQRVTAPDIPPPLYRLEQLYIPGVEDILAACETVLDYA